METLRIERAAEGLEFSYDIVWTDSFSTLGERIAAIPLHPGKICVVTDTNISELYLGEVLGALEGCAGKIISHIIPAGERYKHLNTVSELYGHLISEQFDRKDLLVALGGGVVGDLTGFTAATYLRGISYIQVPTTLLAEVDSSVGGKTGVDFDQFKNMVGAFYQPRLVYMDSAVLQTLPEDQFASGMAEIIKSALIKDASFFMWLLDNADAIRRRDAQTLNEMIRRCCGIKAAVVAEDPKETGLRAILNYGHTIGHAIEKLSNFRMLHGHCVALGMLAALTIDKKRGTINEQELLHVRSLFAVFSLPLYTSGVRVDDILETMRSDKKMERGLLKFILLKRVGEAEICTGLTEHELREAIEEITG